MKELIKKNKLLVVGMIVLVIVLSIVIIINTTSKKLSKDTKYNNSYKPNYDEEFNLGDVLFNSTDVNYDNTDSGLSSTTVKEAIDELYDTILQKECAPGYVKENTIAGHYECTIPPICKAVRNASDLHTATCAVTNHNYCRYNDAYATGETITYGSVWDGESALKAGNAFICDVNGDGDYDAETEWFYYVGPYFNTDDQTFDDETGYATLIYYRGYKNGSPSDEGVAYYGSAERNWYGPRTAIPALPSNKTNGGTWRDDLLKTTDRKILSCNNENCTTLSDKVGSNTITYTPPIYNGKAARLLTLKELARGCGNVLGTAGALQAAGCNFILEGTNYKNNNETIGGVWFENPHASYSGQAWAVLSGTVRTQGILTNNNTGMSVRPTIDVPYVGIVY